MKTPSASRAALLCLALAMLPLAPNAGEFPTASAASLRGTDANNNGIRDDIEPFLAANFGKDERVFRTIANMVISMQYAIQSTNDSESSRAHSMHIRAGECLLSLAAQMRSYLPAFKELDEMVVNTPERVAAWDAHQERIASKSFAVSEAPQWHDGCLKRVDAE